MIITHDIIRVSNYIHTLTHEAALDVAANLRPDDYREVVEGHGHDPMVVLPLAVDLPNSIYFTVPNGKTAGLAGVDELGSVWMLCTPEVERYPHLFVRQAKKYIESRPENLLWNIVDKRNRVHLKLLRFLGFNFLRELKHGPNNLTFIEFCRVRTS